MKHEDKMLFKNVPAAGSFSFQFHSTSPSLRFLKLKYPIKEHGVLSPRNAVEYETGILWSMGEDIEVTDVYYDEPEPKEEQRESPKDVAIAQFRHILANRNTTTPEQQRLEVDRLMDYIADFIDSRG